VGDLARALLIFGPWGLLILFAIVVITNIERVERVAGDVLGLLGWTGGAIRRRSVRTSIQGQVNEFSRSLDTEAKGLIPYNMRLEFVKEMDRAQLLSQKSLVIVRIRDRRDDDRNLVHAMLAFCPVALLPQARPYLDSSLGLAIDLTVTRNLLNRGRHYSALQYLYKDILPRGKSDFPDLDKFCSCFDYLDERGLFTRVILREFRDFGASVQSRYPQPAHAYEARSFVQYVHTVACRQPGEDMAEPGYRGAYISTAFVLIGIGERIQMEGATPYLKHLRYLRSLGFRRAFLAARDTSIDMAERVSYLAEKGTRAKRRTSKEYQGRDAFGRTRKDVLIEMSILPLQSAELPQGHLFEEYV